MQDLIAADGFDSPLGTLDEGDWQTYAHVVASRLGLAAGASVYEVGCGAGAFLLALHAVAGVSTGGCDFSPNLVSAARRALPGGRFAVLEAGRIAKRPRYDSVLSNSVFQYFPDLDYAALVLERMLVKARRSVAVLEVPNAHLREPAEAFRRQQLTPDVYSERYANLAHTYFEPEWFDERARGWGARCEIVPSLIPNYRQGQYRFGAIIRPG
jgi:cyclopropane fatty-acyl-phospholipid synthase-like methyltransferase